METMEVPKREHEAKSNRDRGGNQTQEPKTTDLEPGDLFGTSTSPLVQVPLATLGHFSLDPPTLPPIPNVHVLHDNIPVANEDPPPTDLHPTPKAPCPQLLARLDTDQRSSFLRLWNRLPLHLRDVM